MNICDEVRKGPPKWLTRTIVILVTLMIGIQLGIPHGRRLAATDGHKAELAKRDALIDRLKIALSDTAFDLDVERTKLRILLCESGIRHEGIWGDGGRSYGIAQFQYATFKDLREEAGRPELRWKSRDDQLWLLDWALRHGYGRYWTCYQNREQKTDIRRQTKAKANGQEVAKQ